MRAVAVGRSAHVRGERCAAVRYLHCHVVGERQGRADHFDVTEHLARGRVPLQESAMSAKEKMIS